MINQNYNDIELLDEAIGAMILNALIGGAMYAIGPAIMGGINLLDKHLLSGPPNTKEYDNELSSIAHLDPKDPTYEKKINQFNINMRSAIIDSKGKVNWNSIQKLNYSLQKTSLLDNDNVKYAFQKSGITNEKLFPDLYKYWGISSSDKGFFNILGKAGKKLENFLTSGTPGGTFTLAALISAGVLGTFYLWNKWKEKRQITKEDEKIAKLQNKITEKMYNDVRDKLVDQYNKFILENSKKNGE